MEKDFRSNSHYRDAVEFYTRLLAPGAGHVYNSTDVAIAADGAGAFLVGQCFGGTLEEGPSTALYRCAFDTAQLEKVDERKGARLPRVAPTGDRLAWVASNPQGRGDIVVVASGTGCGTRREFPLAALIEQLSWSADGQRLLVLAAGLAADLAGYQGGVALKDDADETDKVSWLPEVRGDADEDVWRRAWVIDAATGEARRISAETTNVWEAAWCGPDLLLTASDHHSEAAWYGATLRLADISTGRERLLHTPEDQIGLAQASRDGSSVAFIEAICSDRGIVCGECGVGPKAVGLK